jgi:hypothetical protein
MNQILVNGQQSAQHMNKPFGKDNARMSNINVSLTKHGSGEEPGAINRYQILIVLLK